MEEHGLSILEECRKKGDEIFQGTATIPSQPTIIINRDKSRRSYIYCLYYLNLDSHDSRKIQI